MLFRRRCHCLLSVLSIYVAISSPRHTCPAGMKIVLNLCLIVCGRGCLTNSEHQRRKCAGILVSRGFEAVEGGTFPEVLNRRNTPIFGCKPNALPIELTARCFYSTVLRCFVTRSCVVTSCFAGVLTRTDFRPIVLVLCSIVCSIVHDCASTGNR